jgi:hypothetical protein
VTLVNNCKAQVTMLYNTLLEGDRIPHFEEGIADSMYAGTVEEETTPTILHKLYLSSIHFECLEALRDIARTTADLCSKVPST